MDRTRTQVSALTSRVQRNPVLRLAKNSGLLMTANLISRFGSIVLMAVLARHWGQTGVADYVLSMSWGGYTVFFADLGLSVLTIRMLSTVPMSEKGSILGQTLGLKLAVMPVLVLVAMIAWFFLPYRIEVRIAILIVGLAVAISTFSQTFFGAFRSVERMEYEAFLTVSHSVVLIAYGALVVVLGGNIVTIALGFLGLHVLQLSVVIYLWSRNSAKVRLSFPGNPGGMIKQGFPFGVTSLVARGYTETDIQVLSFFVNATVLGAYSAAARLVVAASILPVFISQAVFPVASRLWAQRRNTEFSFLFRSSIQYQFAFSLLFASLLMVLADPLVHIIFGPDFDTSALILKVLALVIPLKYISQPIGNALEASGKQHVRSIIAVLGLATALLLNLVLTPQFGVFGAVMAVIVSELTMLTTMAYSCRYILDWDWGYSGSLIALFCAGLLTYAVGQWFACVTATWQHWLHMFAVGALMTLVSIVLFGASRQLPSWHVIQAARGIGHDNV